MSKLPSYKDLPGEGIPNPDRGGKKYKTYHGTDSQGNAGTWHIYYDEHINPQFIADPITWGPSVPGAHVMNPGPAPAPAPAPQDMTAWGQPMHGAETPRRGPLGATLDHGTVGGGAATIAQQPIPAPAKGQPAPAASSDSGSQGVTWGPDVPGAHVMGSGSVDPPQQSVGAQLGGTVHGGGGLAQQPIPAPEKGVPATTIVGSMGDGITPVSSPTGGTQAPNQESAAVNLNGGYTVKAGDTLSGIAEAHHMSLNELLSLNPQFAKNPDLIHPGEHVNLGGVAEGSMGEATFPTNSSWPPVESSQATGGAQAPDKLSGGYDAGDVPANPEQKIVAVDTSQDTNPLRIDHNQA